MTSEIQSVGEMCCLCCFFLLGGCCWKVGFQFSASGPSKPESSMTYPENERSLYIDIQLETWNWKHHAHRVYLLTSLPNKNIYTVINTHQLFMYVNIPYIPMGMGHPATKVWCFFRGRIWRKIVCSGGGLTSSGPGGVKRRDGWNGQNPSPSTLQGVVFEP